MQVLGALAIGLSFVLSTVAHADGLLKFEPPRLSGGSVPSHLSGIRAFELVWAARDQGWSYESWGTPGDIERKWSRWLSENSADTAAHEGTHVLQAQVGNLKTSALGYRVEPLLIPGRGILLLKHSRALRRNIPWLVPGSLKRSKFASYVGAESGGGTSVAGGKDANVLYLWNEWNAYLNGYSVTVEQNEKKAPLSENDKGELDQLSGPSEFIVYCLATLVESKRAIGDGYSEIDYATLKEAFVLETERAMALVRRTKSLDAKLGYANAMEVLSTLRSADDAEPLRRFLIEEFDARWIGAQLGIGR